MTMHSFPVRTSHISGKEGHKSNKGFMILSALGILFVVDVHLENPLGILTQIFPYDSFFMPMFAFISGYFVKDSNSQTWQAAYRYTLTKVRRLLLPYLGWVLFYNILSAVLFRLDYWSIPALSLRDLIYAVVTTGVTSAFNSPAWFAPLLFAVSVSYCAIRWIFQKIWNDHFALVLFLAAGTAAVWAAGTGFNVPLHHMLLKIPFFLQFYYLGTYFRKYWEGCFDKLNTFAVCLGAVFLNILLIRHYGKTVEFPICSSMSGFHSGNLFLPLVTSVTGTAFWLKMAKTLVPILGHNRLVNYISENTFFIMTHHIGVKHLFIGLCLLGYRAGLSVFSGIDVQQFLSDGLYLYNAHPWCTPVCLLFSMAVLLPGCKLFESLRNSFYRMVKKQP